MSKRRLLSQAGLLAILVAIQPLEWHFVKAATHDWQQQRQRRLQVEELTRVNTQLAGMLDQQQRTQPYVEVTAPGTVDLVKQTDHLESLARRFRLTVTLQNISEESDQEISPLRLLRILLTAAGSPEDLLSYLDAIEHDPHLNRVIEWELKSAGPPEAPTFQLNAEIEYYFVL